MCLLFLSKCFISKYKTALYSNENFILVSTASSLASASSSVSTDGHVTTTRASSTFHPLDTDYTPIIISIAAGFACFIVYVCFMCIVHSWWLKRNKFTEVNSTPLKDIEKKKRKEELREMRRQRKGNSQVSSYSFFNTYDEYQVFNVLN